MSFGGRFSHTRFSLGDVEFTKRQLEKLQEEKRDLLNIPLSIEDEKYSVALSEKGSIALGDAFKQKVEPNTKTLFGLIDKSIKILAFIYTTGLHEKINKDLYLLIKSFTENVIQRFW